MLTVIAADGVVTNTFVYEKRVGPRSMLEVTRRWSSPRALQETGPVASAIWASRSSSVEGVRTAAREPVDVGIARSGCSFTS